MPTKWGRDADDDDKKEQEEYWQRRDQRENFRIEVGSPCLLALLIFPLRIRQ
jgi:hypothetical protein